VTGTEAPSCSVLRNQTSSSILHPPRCRARCHWWNEHYLAITEPTTLHLLANCHQIP